VAVTIPVLPFWERTQSIVCLRQAVLWAIGYFQGCVGGLMMQLHTAIPHRNGVDKFKDASFDKAQALGENLAILTVNALRGEKAWRPTDTQVAVAAKTIFVPMSGLFGYGVFLGLVHPGWYWGKGKTEMDVIQIGDVEILTIPGEMYPEIAEGGIEFVANTDTAMLRVDLGMVMTLIPERIMSTSFDSSRVRFCELAGLETEFEMVAIYRKDNQQQTLLSFLKSIRS